MTETSVPCRYCGSPSLSDGAHVYGERKCCPDCDHRPPAHLPGRMEAIALDVDGNVLARCPLDGTGQVTFDLPDDVDQVATVRWTDADGVTHDTYTLGRLPAPRPAGPRGECPTCHRDLELDIDRDPPCSYFIPLHGGWPPCEGSGMPT